MSDDPYAPPGDHEAQEAAAGWDGVLARALHDIAGILGVQPGPSRVVRTVQALAGMVDHPAPGNHHPAAFLAYPVEVTGPLSAPLAGEESARG